MTGFQSQPCMFCGKPSGMLPLDVWSIPPGAVASLLVQCAECRERTKEVPLTAKWAMAPSDLEGEPPEDPRACSVIVLRWRGQYVAITCDGGVVDECAGFQAMEFAFEHGARVIAERRAGHPMAAKPRYTAQITVTCDDHDRFRTVTTFDGLEVWRGEFTNMPHALRIATSEALHAEELLRVPDRREPVRYDEQSTATAAEALMDVVRRGRKP